MTTEVSAEQELEAMERLEAVVCWLNQWGDEDKHRGESREWRAGYYEAVREAMRLLEPLAPDWLETWRGGRWKQLLAGGPVEDSRG